MVEQRGDPSPLSQDEVDNLTFLLLPLALAASSSLLLLLPLAAFSISAFMARQNSRPRSCSLELNRTATRGGSSGGGLQNETKGSTWTRPRRIKIQCWTAMS